MNKTKVNKVVLFGTAVLTTLSLGIGIVRDVSADEIETNVEHRIDDVFVNNIDVKYNGQSINSGYVEVEAGERPLLEITLSTTGGIIPPDSWVNLTSNGVSIVAKVQIEGKAFSELPIDIEAGKTYLVNISTSGFAGDAPQTITFVGKGPVVPPVEPDKPTDPLPVEPENPAVDPEPVDPENPDIEVEYPDGKSDLTPEQQEDALNRPTESDTQTDVFEVESTEVEAQPSESTAQSIESVEQTETSEVVAERTTQSSIQSITETSETMTESQPATQENEEIKELPKTGTKQSKFLKVLGIFLLGLALGNLLFIFRKGGK